MNLRFDDDAGRAVLKQPPGHVECVFAIFHHLAARHGDSIFRENGFSLVLVYFHVGMTTAGGMFTRGPGQSGRICLLLTRMA